MSNSPSLSRKSVSSFFSASLEPVRNGGPQSTDKCPKMSTGSGASGRFGWKADIGSFSRRSLALHRGTGESMTKPRPSPRSNIWKPICAACSASSASPPNSSTPMASQSARMSAWRRSNMRSARRCCSRHRQGPFSAAAAGSRPTSSGQAIGAAPAKASSTRSSSGRGSRWAWRSSPRSVQWFECLPKSLSGR